ncbi:hypothetical protein [Haladaptatus cibarius]|uniref:hypothetical protein n=1 Tax=Haladaptatus cibarius TaxID=453847 RepID=UPI000678A307|nr:hypothetical protein [Haladaptatus cibarius]
MRKPNQLEGRKKGLVALSIVGIVIVAGVSGAVILRDESTLDAEFEVVSWSDPTDVQRATQMQVRVTNTGDQSISPVFNTLHGGLQTRNYWNIESGAETLDPGERSTYRISAQVPQFGPPFGSETVLSLNDIGTDVQKKKIVPPFSSDTAPKILNPQLQHWQINPGEDFFRPYRWGISTSDHGTEELTIENKNDSAHLRVDYAARKEGPWAMAGIQQRTDFPEKLHIEATPHTLVENPIKHPSHATGVEIGERNHRVWVVYADVDERQVVYRPGEYQYILVYVPATEGERVETTVDIANLYDQYGWSQPESETRHIDGREYDYQPVNTLAFAAAYPSYQNETVEVVFHEIRSEK